MDDNLEAPSSLPPKTPLGDLPPDADEDQSSDEEDGGLDWTKLLPAAARPVIPKRGEKEFEPRQGGGTNLQLHVLDRSRNAMFETLRATRTISSKVVSYATWHADIGRTHVTVARGIHFSNMGHSAPRSVLGEDGTAKIQKRLELLPEEAIYLIERGSLFCWKDIDLDMGIIPGMTEINGSPMSVQQAFSEMIGREDLTLEKFQVYSYLKRLGYVVTRATPPDTYYPVPPPRTVSSPTSSILTRIKSLFPLWVSSISRTLFGGFNWWRPVGISRWFSYDKSYPSLFRAMRFLPAGHGVPLNTVGQKKSTPYQIFYNLYKPSTPFKKSAPPPPDFQIVVINARTTPMPTLQELTDLFDVLPESPLPPPRQRRPPPGTTANAPSPPKIEPVVTPAPKPSCMQRVFPWIFPTPPPIATTPAPRKLNPFMALKTGKKIIVIAAVDASNISFFRFGQGEFTEWPMV
ncbi:putative tRNA-splicing endonuclease subunit sen54 [Psilocybe cubensis]|uniref:tRNA-splicing endonuclease subunit sen54 n=2 Tax=Psilocybe cubensis TaxID=181762 RepID=A0ACB8GXJ3_PSICU|nr:putative tRNA-splicing endonuclease subunit sen54 [Psilocybe cubensis]KAH9480353.1 putative tRNA-splicing endonuclease subunit sen54 [Psilocybe cubensis]